MPIHDIPTLFSDHTADKEPKWPWDRGWLGSAKVAQCAYLSEAERGSKHYFRESTKWKENTAQI